MLCCSERREGHGIHTEADGSLYEGQWKAGQRHGKGMQSWAASGDKYEGEWKNDLRDGNGRLCFSDGRVYVGGWVKDRPQGRGKFVDTDSVY